MIPHDLLPTLSPATPLRVALLAGALTLAACDAPEPAAPVSPPPEPGAVASGGKPSTDVAVDPAQMQDNIETATAAEAAPDFVGQVWRVRESAAVEVGTTYAFLEDGTLVIDAPHGTTAYGRWDYNDGALNLTEEGVSYRTEIVAASDSELHLRSHNPGEPLEMVLAPAPDEPLPPAQPTSDGGAH